MSLKNKTDFKALFYAIKQLFSKIIIYFLFDEVISIVIVVRTKGLEPSHLAAPDPKSGFYTNYK